MKIDKKEVTNLPDKFIVIGQFPPPVHGFSYITEQMTARLSKQYDVTTIDLVPHTARGGVLYQMRRIKLAIKGVITILFYYIRERRKKAKSSIYLGCESNLGLLYTILFALISKIVGFPLYIHYHNFNYIYKHNHMMAILLMLVGNYATHIFLCPTMGEKLAKQYNKKLKSITISNSAFVSSTNQPFISFDPEQTLHIGLLSNLDDEKGLSIFLDTLRKCLSENMNVKAVLAGPPVKEDDARKIEEAKKEFGDRLDYRGAVYGDDKVKFFNDIDVFVFPTCYPFEAQPTVIAESLSSGVPIVSFDRGCICNQVGDCGKVFAKGENFAEEAVKWLKASINEKNFLNDLKKMSFKRFQEDKEAAQKIASDITIAEKTILG